MIEAIQGFLTPGVAVIILIWMVVITLISTLYYIIKFFIWIIRKLFGKKKDKDKEIIQDVPKKVNNFQEGLIDSENCLEKETPVTGVVPLEEESTIEDIPEEVIRKQLESENVDKTNIVNGFHPMVKFYK